MNNPARLLVSLAVPLIGFCQDLATLSGRVTDTSTLEVPDAEVSLRRSPGGPAFKTARTLTNGTFQFDGIPPGKYYIQVEHAGFFTTRLEPAIELAAGEVKELPVIRMRNPRDTCKDTWHPPGLENTRLSAGQSRLVGSVLKDGNGNRLREASLVLQRKDRTAAAIEVKTGADGNFRMNALPPGSYTLAISHAGYRVFLIDVVPIKAGYETRIQSIQMRGCPRQGECKPARKIWMRWCEGYVY
ncbi:MAG: carboxypeptidase-like regulatory domain-containing protein [Bryobacteraceae bacterium]|jgi:hypothetical protein